MFNPFRHRPPRGVPAERYVRLPGCEGVIFPADQGFLCDEPAGTFWTPAREHARAAEERVGAFLRAARPGIAGRLNRYRRQYVGVIKGDRRLLYMNFFDDTSPWTRDWPTRPVVVEDGGDAYFQVLYDVESGEFIDLYVNGEA